MFYAQSTHTHLLRHVFDQLLTGRGQGHLAAFQRAPLFLQERFRTGQLCRFLANSSAPEGGEKKFVLVSHTVHFAKRSSGCGKEEESKKQRKFGRKRGRREEEEEKKKKRRRRGEEEEEAIIKLILFMNPDCLHIVFGFLKNFDICYQQPHKKKIYTSNDS